MFAAPEPTVLLRHVRFFILTISATWFEAGVTVIGVLARVFRTREYDSANNMRYNGKNTLKHVFS